MLNIPKNERVTLISELGSNILLYSQLLPWQRSNTKKHPKNVKLRLHDLDSEDNLAGTENKHNFINYSFLSLAKIVFAWSKKSSDSLKTLCSSADIWYEFKNSDVEL